MWERRKSRSLSKQSFATYVAPTTAGWVTSRVRVPAAGRCARRTAPTRIRSVRGHQRAAARPWGEQRVSTSHSSTSSGSMRTSNRAHQNQKRQGPSTRRSAPWGEQRVSTSRVRVPAAGRCARRTAPTRIRSVRGHQRAAARPWGEQRVSTSRVRAPAAGRCARRTSSSPNADAAPSRGPWRRRRRSPGPAPRDHPPSRRCATGAGSSS